VLSEIVSGKHHAIYIPTDQLEVFRAWVAELQRPKAPVLNRLIVTIADTEFTTLQLSKFWIFERDSVYAIKKDQARIYCCTIGSDIIILSWDQKKQHKANTVILDKAVRLAKQYRK
jgi:hypothetical protein